MVARCSNGVAFVVLEAAPSVRTGIRVEIYDGDNPNTLLEILENSFARQWTDPLRGPGTGSFSIHATDPKLVGNPGLLAYGNIARFYLDNVARFAITIEHKNRRQLGEGEDVQRVLKVSGRGVLAKLEDSQVYRSAGLTGDVERPFNTNAGEAIRALVAEGQARGGLVGITTSFDDADDSNNAPFSVPIELTERAGTDLLRVAERHGELAVDVFMSPSLVLNYYNARGFDRSIQTVNAGPVILQAGDNITELESDEDGAIRNALLIETPTAWLERTEGASISAHGRREAFLSLGNVNSSDQVDRASASVFQRSAEPAEAKTLAVTDKEGQRPYVDWGVGDWVLAPDETGALERFRVRAMTVTETETGQPQFVPELATITQELEERLQRWLAAMERGTMGGTASAVAEPVKTPTETAEAISSGIGDHLAATPHADEFSDLADVDLAGLADEDTVAYDAGDAAWKPIGRTLDDHTDTDLAGATTGQVVTRSFAGLWVPATPSGGGGGGITPIDPDAPADLVAWLEADAISGLTNGDPVATWPDSSAAGNDFTEGTAANRPLWITGALNGLPVVRFDATNDGMLSALAISSGTYTFIAVYKYNSPTTSANRRVIQGSTNWLLGPYGRRYQFHNGGFSAAGPGAGLHHRIHTAVLDNVGHHYVDGDFAGSGTSVGFPGTIGLGIRGAINEPADSDVAEIIIYTRSLPRTERVGVEEYLRQKYDL